MKHPPVPRAKILNRVKINASMSQKSHCQQLTLCSNGSNFMPWFPALPRMRVITWPCILFYDHYTVLCRREHFQICACSRVWCEISHNSAYSEPSEWSSGIHYNESPLYPLTSTIPKCVFHSSFLIPLSLPYSTEYISIFLPRNATIEKGKVSLHTYLWCTYRVGMVFEMQHIFALIRLPFAPTLLQLRSQLSEFAPTSLT